MVFIVSDTHDNLSSVKKFLSVLRSVTKPSYLIHLGDIVSPFTLRLLAEELPQNFGLKVVLGNNDGDKMLLSSVAKEVADQPEEVELCGMKVMLLHGFKSPELTEKIVGGIACSGHYDIVMYGHTHRFKLRECCASYILNPGTLSGYLSNEATYALLDCEGFTASVVDLETGRKIVTIPVSAKNSAHRAKPGEQGLDHAYSNSWQQLSS